ncbi:MAG: hypothetical protein ACRDX8_12095 [Acidimicrobiales bacterium]
MIGFGIVIILGGYWVLSYGLYTVIGWTDVGFIDLISPGGFHGKAPVRAPSTPPAVSGKGLGAAAGNAISSFMGGATNFFTGDAALNAGKALIQSTPGAAGAAKKMASMTNAELNPISCANRPGLPASKSTKYSVAQSQAARAILLTRHAPTNVCS